MRRTLDSNHKQILFYMTITISLEQIWVSWYTFLLYTKLGALQDILHMNDVLARVSLARLCHSISRARALDGKYIKLFLFLLPVPTLLFLSGYMGYGRGFFEDLQFTSFISIFLQKGLILGLSSTQFFISYS